MDNLLFDQARTFILNNARLLERRQFSFLFENGTRESVLVALRAYQNPDGGFGNALEPDKRTSSSQPIDQEFALRVMDITGLDVDLTHQMCHYLATVTTPTGGVPFVLPTVRDAPRCPWWNCPDDPPDSINPTASIAGILHKHHFQHPWLDAATDYCWRAISKMQDASDNDLLCVVLFLEGVPDRNRAAREFERIGEWVKQHAALDPDAPGYVHKPLGWAPSPSSMCRSLFDDLIIEKHLDALIAQQKSDGGWDINWTPASPADEFECRGIVSLINLRILKAYRRL
jgi:hypothetical protein